MFDRIIAVALVHRGLVLVLAAVLLVFGTVAALDLPIDVFPDLDRPTVTILTEAPGLAPEEVEILVTFPIETALFGATGVERVRSSSAVGLSIVWAEFAWGSDVLADRQIVAEKLSLARERLPEGLEPVLAPVSSIMGEIQLVGLQSETGETSAMELRTLADWTIRPRLLAVPGVSQVTVIGGEVREIQALVSPEELLRHGVTLKQLREAVEKANVAKGGGFLLEGAEESLIRVVGRATRPEDVAQAVVAWRDPLPVVVRDVASVGEGSPVRRGVASVDARPAVILSIQKQPGADTLDLDRAVRSTFDELRPTLPKDVRLREEVFRQASFIGTAIANVEEAIRDGGIWVVVVLLVFLWNLRASVVTILAIPLSVIATALAFRALGASINTMTLGGLAVAIGELVDDSIVDVENIHRRLRENRLRAVSEPWLVVVFKASSEIRNSIVTATMIVVLVVFPLFSLAGLEGRLFAPLGVSYLVTLAASLLVSLTVTPALASYLLPGAPERSQRGDTPVVRVLKRADEKLLRFTLRHPLAILCAVALLAAAAVGSVAFMGGEFLPPFNEGTLTVNVLAEPGTSLEESDRLGTRVERSLLEIGEVESTARRTGRAELDEHAEGVHYSEIDVRLRAEGGRPKDEVLEDVRRRLGAFPGVAASIGQPISHRLDHILSGIRAQIAVKIFGPDLPVLRDAAQRARDAMAGIEGVVDLQVEPQVEIPEVKVEILREEAARLGLPVGDVAEVVETAFRGAVVSEVLDRQRSFDLVVWLEEGARDDVGAIRSLLLDTPSGARVPLGQVARVVRSSGPNTIQRENVARRIVVSCNVAGRDLTSVVEDVKAAVGSAVVPGLPPNVFVRYGGQFEAQAKAETRLFLLGALALLAIASLLAKSLGSWRAALQVMVNIPLAAIGSVSLLLLTTDGWPTLSLAHWIGFITLTGIVSRNGIMMISHYVHLMRHEGEAFDEKMIVRGSLERLVPVLMTALTTVIGLMPLALGAGETGREILHPLAIVVIGGIASSTLLDQIVTPALFFRFGRRIYEPRDARETPPIPVPPALAAAAGPPPDVHRKDPER